MCLVTLTTIVLLSIPSAQPIETEPVTAVEQGLVIASLIETLQRDYVDPVMADHLIETLNRNLGDGAYSGLDTPHDLATTLSKDLVDGSGDLHFQVTVDPEWVATEREKESPAVRKRQREHARATAEEKNHGFRDVRILEGNVGYLRFSYFEDPELAHETVAATMAFLAHTDAIVFDLRYNNGGYLEMAQLLISYFLDSGTSQRLYAYHDLDDGERIEREMWVLPSVSGARMVDVPLYVLTSSMSFSAAEWFAFVLKNLERATVIGEQTAGGAHPVNRRVLNDRFVVQIPTGQIKDGVLGQDFEGTGVAPDIAANAEDALHTAHRHALSTLIARMPEQAAHYDWFMPVVDARLSTQPIDPAVVHSFIGTYDDGARRISLEAGALIYHWKDRFRVKLQPLSATLLAVDGVDDFRFQLRVENGVVTGIERVFHDGHTSFHPKAP